MWTASAHIITAVIGSGVLSLAWAMSQLGWVAGPVTLVLFSIITFFTSSLLTDCYRTSDPISGKRNYTYNDAVKSILGHLFIHSTTIYIFIHICMYLLIYIFCIYMQITNQCRWNTSLDVWTVSVCQPLWSGHWLHYHCIYKCCVCCSIYFINLNLHLYI